MIVSKVAERISSFEYGISMWYMRALRNSRSMWSWWRKTAVPPSGVSYARTPSNTLVP